MEIYDLKNYPACKHSHMYHSADGLARLESGPSGSSPGEDADFCRVKPPAYLAGTSSAGRMCSSPSVASSTVHRFALRNPSSTIVVSCLCGLVLSEKYRCFRCIPRCRSYTHHGGKQS